SRKAHGCVTPKGPETASCDWPMVRSGRGCVCAQGYKQGHGGCFKPPVVVIEPPRVVPVGPAPSGPPLAPVGPGPGGPPRVVPGGRVPSGPPKMSPVQPVSTHPATQTNIAATQCLPQDLYDLLQDAYGKRPGLSPCPTSCLPKPVSYAQSDLD